MSLLLLSFQEATVLSAPDECYQLCVCVCVCAFFAVVVVVFVPQHMSLFPMCGMFALLGVYLIKTDCDFSSLRFLSMKKLFMKSEVMGWSTK